MKYLLLVSLLSAQFFALGQMGQGNYILVINGDSTSIDLNKPQTINTKSGAMKVLLKQKDVLTYSSPEYSFQYPATTNISSKKLDVGIEQLMCVSALGNGFMIQKFSSMNPELIVDLMLTELTEESKAAGYVEKLETTEKVLANGSTIKGKRSTLTLDEETSIYTVYPVKIKKGGILIVTMVSEADDTDENIITRFWNTLQVGNK